MTSLEAIELAKELGLESEDFDEEVANLKSEEASAINDRGLEGQIAFIMDELGPDFDKNYLKELAEDRE